MIEPGGVTTVFIGIYVCLNAGSWREVFDVNMGEGQRELDRQRRKRQPAPKPNVPACPQHDDRYRSGQLGPYIENYNTIPNECPLWVKSRQTAPGENPTLSAIVQKRTNAGAVGLSALCQ